MKDLRPKFKIADDFLVQNLDANVIVEHLEEQIELRELPIEEHAKRLLRKQQL